MPIITIDATASITPNGGYKDATIVSAADLVIGNKYLVIGSASVNTNSNSAPSGGILRYSATANSVASDIPLGSESSFELNGNISNSYGFEGVPFGIVKVFTCPPTHTANHKFRWTVKRLSTSGNVYTSGKFYVIDITNWVEGEDYWYNELGADVTAQYGTVISHHTNWDVAALPAGDYAAFVSTAGKNASTTNTSNKLKVTSLASHVNSDNSHYAAGYIEFEDATKESLSVITGGLFYIQNRAYSSSFTSKVESSGSGSVTIQGNGTNAILIASHLVSRVFVKTPQYDPPNSVTSPYYTLEPLDTYIASNIVNSYASSTSTLLMAMSVRTSISPSGDSTVTSITGSQRNDPSDRMVASSFAMYSSDVQRNVNSYFDFEQSTGSDGATQFATAIVLKNKADTLIVNASGSTSIATTAQASGRAVTPKYASAATAITTQTSAEATTVEDVWVRTSGATSITTTAQASAFAYSQYKRAQATTELITKASLKRPQVVKPVVVQDREHHTVSTMSPKAARTVGEKGVMVEVPTGFLKPSSKYLVISTGSIHFTDSGGLTDALNVKLQYTSGSVVDVGVKQELQSYSGIPASYFGANGTVSTDNKVAYLSDVSVFTTPANHNTATDTLKIFYEVVTDNTAYTYGVGGSFVVVDISDLVEGVDYTYITNETNPLYVGGNFTPYDIPAAILPVGGSAIQISSVNIYPKVGYTGKTGYGGTIWYANNDRTQHIWGAEKQLQTYVKANAYWDATALIRGGASTVLVTVREATATYPSQKAGLPFTDDPSIMQLGTQKYFIAKSEAFKGTVLPQDIGTGNTNVSTPISSSSYYSSLDADGKRRKYFHNQYTSYLLAQVDAPVILLGTLGIVGFQRDDATRPRVDFAVFPSGSQIAAGNGQLVTNTPAESLALPVGATNNIYSSAQYKFAALNVLAGDQVTGVVEVFNDNYFYLNTADSYHTVSMLGLGMLGGAPKGVKGAGAETFVIATTQATAQAFNPIQLASARTHIQTTAHALAATPTEVGAITHIQSNVRATAGIIKTKGALTSITCDSSATATIGTPAWANPAYRMPLGAENTLLADITLTAPDVYRVQVKAILTTSIPNVVGYEPPVILLNRSYQLGIPVIKMARTYELLITPMLYLNRNYGLRTSGSSFEINFTRTYELYVGAVSPNEIHFKRHYSMFNNAFEDRLLQLINEERETMGVAGRYLKSDQYAAIQNVAQVHSRHIDVYDDYNHESSAFPATWQTVKQRVTKLAPLYNNKYFAENINSLASTFDPADLNQRITADRLFETWKASAGHYANMMYDWSSTIKEGEPNIDVILGLHSYSTDHLNDTYHGDYYNYGSSVFYMLIATHKFIISQRSVAVTTRLNLQRAYELKAPTTVKLYRGYSLTAYAHIVATMVAKYSESVTATLESSYSSKVSNVLVGMIGWNVSKALESSYGGSVDASQTFQSGYTIHAGEIVKNYLEGIYGETVAAAMISSYGSTLVQKQSLNSTYSGTSLIGKYFEGVHGQTSIVEINFTGHYGQSHEVATVMQASYDQSREVSVDFNVYYGITKLVGNYLLSDSSYSTSLSKELIAAYSDVDTLSKEMLVMYSTGYNARNNLESSYRYNVEVAQVMSVSFAMTTDSASTFNSTYDLALLNRAANYINAPYHIAGSDTRTYSGSAFVIIAGEKFPVDTVEIGIGEDDSYWSGRITVKDSVLFSTLKRGVRFSLDFFGTEYRLVVKSRATSRPSIASITRTVEVATIASLRHDEGAATITYANTETVLASVLAERVLGSSIIWNTIDWPIPAYRYSVEGVTPIEAAKVILEAVGSILTSNPRGEFIAQAKHKESYDDYPTKVDSYLSDFTDNVSQTENPDLTDVRNKYRITESLSVFSDKIDYEEDEDTEGVTLPTGKLVVYPSPWRTSVQIRTTSGANVPVTFVGIEEREETETLEFVRGAANAGHPVVELRNIEWLSEPLGGLAVEEYSTSISSASSTNEGYGLAKITYKTKAIVYRTSLPEDVEVQFILEDLG